MAGISYQFLPWLRRGLPTSSAKVSGGRSVLQVELSLSAQTLSLTRATSNVELPPKTIELYGPGDIVGFDSSLVARTDPTAKVGDFEPNFFPMVEFTEPDFPWRFTPGPANEQGNLSPWICLIALIAEDIVDADNNGTVKKKEFSEAPRTERDILPSITVTNARSLPNLGEAWRWAHVQLTGDSATENKNLSAVQRDTPERVVSRLLCARRLRPRTLYRAFIVPAFLRGRQAGRGREPTESSDSSQLAWSANDENVDLPYYFDWEFRTGYYGDFEYLVRQLRPQVVSEEVGTRLVDGSEPGYGLQEQALDAFKLQGALLPVNATSDPGPKLNLSSISPSEKPSERPRVVPPTYGRLHVDPKSSSPPWLSELNSHPMYRIAAGLGAKAVRLRQDALVKDAWRQANTTYKENVELARAKFGIEISGCSFKRLQRLEPGPLLRITSPVHARFKLPDQSVTLREQFRSQQDPPLNLHHPTFRRLGRPRGAMAKRAGGPTTELGDAFVRLYTRQIDVGFPNAVRRRIGLAAIADIPSLYPVSRAQVTLSEGLLKAGLTPGRLATDFAEQWLKTTPRPIAFAPAEAPPTVDDVKRIKRGIVGDINSDLLSNSRALLNPSNTIMRRARQRLGYAVSDVIAIEKHMISPSFTFPVYEWLRDLSEEFLLPGIDKVAQNTVFALKTNWPFVEAFLCGANHEFAAELLWREFPAMLSPADTYFNRFWEGLSVTGTPPRDIGPISRWTSLGQNAINGIRKDDDLILLFRGELFNKYPNTAIYLADINEGANRNVPVFQARIPPDITLVGFAITSDDAKRKNVILEQPIYEPRFGMDDIAQWPLTKWQDLAWGHFPKVGTDQYLDDALPGETSAASLAVEGLNWGASSAVIARATLQNPVRVLVSGSDLLPVIPA